MNGSRLVLVLVVTALPAVGRAQVSLSGNAGALYTHTLFSGPGVAPWTDLRWSLLGALETHGSAWSERVLAWDGAVQYGHARQSLRAVQAAGDQLTFSGDVRLFSGSPLPVGLRASRQIADLLPATTEPLSLLGSVATTRYEATAGALWPGLPQLRATVSRTDADVVSFDRSSTRRGSTALQVSAEQHLPGFRYDLGYDTSWNQGSLEELRYRAHRFGLGAQAELAAGTRLSLTQHYLARIPTDGASLLNPRSDSTEVGATLDWAPAADSTSVLGYRYASQIATADDRGDQARLLHRLSYAWTFRPVRVLSAHATAAADYGFVRAGALSVGGTGQSAGAGVTWTPRFAGLEAMVRGGGQVGLVERPGEPVDLQWGAQGGGSLTRPFGGLSATAAYAASYERGGVTLPGWAVSQEARVDLAGLVLEELQLRVGAAAASSRRDDRVLGSRYARNLSLITEARWRLLSFNLLGGLDEGVPLALPELGGGDGLFLTPRFTTRSRYLNARLGWNVLPRLAFSASVQLARLQPLEGPAQGEVLALASAAYGVGLIQLGLEYRLSFSERGGTWGRSHTFHATATRAFSFF